MKLWIEWLEGLVGFGGVPEGEPDAGGRGWAASIGERHRRCRHRSWSSGEAAVEEQNFGVVKNCYCCCDCCDWCCGCYCCCCFDLYYYYLNYNL